MTLRFYFLSASNKNGMKMNKKKWSKLPVIKSNTLLINYFIESKQRNNSSGTRHINFLHQKRKKTKHYYGRSQNKTNPARSVGTNVSQESTKQGMLNAPKGPFCPSHVSDGGKLRGNILHSFPGAWSSTVFFFPKNGIVKINKKEKEKTFY